MRTERQGGGHRRVPEGLGDARVEAVHLIDVHTTHGQRTQAHAVTAASPLRPCLVARRASGAPRGIQHAHRQRHRQEGGARTRTCAHAHAHAQDGGGALYGSGGGGGGGGGGRARKLPLVAGAMPSAGAPSISTKEHVEKVCLRWCHACVASHTHTIAALPEGVDWENSPPVQTSRQKTTQGLESNQEPC